MNKGLVGHYPFNRYKHLIYIKETIMSKEIIRFNALTKAQKMVEIKRWITFLKRGRKDLLTSFELQVLKLVANSKSL